jgi:hypothetical protein
MCGAPRADGSVPSLLSASDLRKLPLFAQLTDAQAARLVVIQTGAAAAGRPPLRRPAAGVHRDRRERDRGLPAGAPHPSVP